jgi:hypothetical protein
MQNQRIQAKFTIAPFVGGTETLAQNRGYG